MNVPDSIARIFQQATGLTEEHGFIEYSFSVEETGVSINLNLVPDDKEVIRPTFRVLSHEKHYNDRISRITVIELFKGYKEVGNAFIRESNDEAAKSQYKERMSKKPKGGIVEGPDNIDRRYE